MAGELEPGPHLARDEIEVLAVLGDVTAHKRAERQDGRAFPASLGERGLDELRSEAPALEARIDLRVHERDHSRAAVIRGEPGGLAVDANLKARAVRHVDDLD